MKKIFLSIILLTSILVFFACEEDDEKFIEAAGVAVVTDGATELDNEVILSITANNPMCTQIEVTGDATGSVTLTNGKGSLTLSTAALGIADADDEASLTFTANTERNPVVFLSITMKDPISITGIDELLHNSKVKKVFYEVSPVAATVSNVIIATKVTKAATYVDLAGTFDVEKDSISFVGTDYNIGDTVYCRITATAGSLTSEKETSFVVGISTFANSADAAIDFTDAGFDFVDVATVDAGTDTTDIEILASGVGFESTNGTEFVVSDSTMYADADVVLVKAAFDAGTSVSSVDPVAKDAVYIYKTTRPGDDGDIEYYGILKVNKLILTSADANDGFEFSYKY